MTPDGCSGDAGWLAGCQWTGGLCLAAPSELIMCQVPPRTKSRYSASAACMHVVFMPSGKCKWHLLHALACCLHPTACSSLQFVGGGVNSRLLIPRRTLRTRSRVFWAVGGVPYAYEVGVLATGVEQLKARALRAPCVCYASQPRSLQP